MRRGVGSASLEFGAERLKERSGTVPAAPLLSGHHSRRTRSRSDSTLSECRRILVRGRRPAPRTCDAVLFFSSSSHYQRSSLVYDCVKRAAQGAHRGHSTPSLGADPPPPRGLAHGRTPRLRSTLVLFSSLSLAQSRASYITPSLIDRLRALVCRAFRCSPWRRTFFRSRGPNDE